jgi:ATP diphosphatase
MNWQDRVQRLDSLSGIEKLKEIMSMLRDPEHGCPWDKEQTFETIVPYTIEEAYEVADAIEKGDMSDVKSELGDLLFQTVFYGQMATEQNVFNFDDIAETMAEKLIRRHPHVFGNSDFKNEAEIKANWEAEKAKERQQKDANQTSALDDIPTALPALSRAYKLQKRAASVGFDWPNIDGALDKVMEEINEVKVEVNSNNANAARIADELGDLYFALTNVVRHLKLKPEQVLHQANRKFERRFRAVEQKVVQQNNSITEMSLEQLDGIWEQVKAEEKQ